MNTSLFESRFWSYVNKKCDDECWEWVGCKIIGYGMMKVNSKPFKAHRLSWIIHYGEIPNGMCVCHKCDNPSCVNPKHLYLGTCADNNKDRNEKGRSRGKCLTKQEIESIRKEYKWKEITLDFLSKKYGVGITYIWRVTRNDNMRKEQEYAR